MARRQAVFEAQEALVGAVGDLAPSLGHRQENLIPQTVHLHIGSHFYLVVVGNNQLKLQFASLLEDGQLFSGPEIVADIVDQLHHVGPFGFDIAAAAHPAPDDGLYFSVDLAVDDNPVKEQQSP